MKACVLNGVNDFSIEDTSVPVPKENEVLVHVKAVGICGSDIPRIYKTGAHIHPIIPGHEFAGMVEKAGTGDAAHWLNKRVGIFPLIPCGKCVPCQKKQYEMCRNYSYLGSRRDGGFAEYVTVPEWNLIELPDGVSYESAAMLEPMSVAVHAMRRVFPCINSTVVICGLGTIGLLLYMFLQNEKKYGSEQIGRILVIGNKEFQKQKAMEMGLPETDFCDSRTENVQNWILENTDGSGADVFFECVGKNETLVQAVDLTAPAGKICLIGNPYSDMHIDKDIYWKILRNQLTITGTWNSSFVHSISDDWHYVLDKLQKKQVSPEKLISHRFPLEKLHQGLEIMNEKIEDYVKIMIGHGN